MKYVLKPTGKFFGVSAEIRMKVFIPIEAESEEEIKQFFEDNNYELLDDSNYCTDWECYDFEIEKLDKEPKIVGE